MSPCLIQAQQQWAIAPVANARGCPGSPFFKVTIAGTATDFCARFLDQNDRPIKTLTATLTGR